MSSITRITSREVSAPYGIWSQAMKVAAGTDLIFVSGLTAREPDGSVHGEGDIRAQTERVLESLTHILEADGATLADVVKVTVFVRDITEFDTIHAVRKEFFSEPYPASSMVEVSRLADDRSLIEIEAIAAVPSRS